MKLLIILAFIFVGCTSSKKTYHESGEPVPKMNTAIESIPKDTTISRPAAVIDYPSIQRLLNLDKRYTQLGYSEKTFNTCQVGFGYSDRNDCQKKYFVVIHFKLVCRESEGTISTILTDADLKPISGQSVSWYLKSINGHLVTDGEGYGQIITATDQSQSGQRLRLAVGSDFLFLKAGEVGRLIAPASWCNH